jgi:hypothetical protein
MTGPTEHGSNIFRKGDEHFSATKIEFDQDIGMVRDEID